MSEFKSYEDMEADGEMTDYLRMVRDSYQDKDIKKDDSGCPIIATKFKRRSKGNE